MDSVFLKNEITMKVYEKFSREIIFATALAFIGVIVALIIHHIFEDKLPLIIAYTITYEIVILAITAIYSFLKYIREEKDNTDPFEVHLQKLFAINKLNNVNLKNFIVNELFVSELEKFQNFITGNEITCPYSTQIQLADVISIDAKKYFWATSLDSPSTLFKQGVHYFDCLEKIVIPNELEKTIPKKSRIVVSKFDDLYKDFQGDRRNFQNFIDWHNRNNWGLRFYIVLDNDDINSEFIKNVDDSAPIRDFLIKDDECVFGRVSQVDTKNVTIKLILEDWNVKTKISKYKVFYEYLWANSLESKMVVQKILNKMSEKSLRSALIKDYPTFSGFETGQDFFLKVCESIENANTNIFAIDVADLKETVIAWKTNIAYQGFFKACISAAKKNEVSRIFILTNFDSIILKDSIEIILEQLLSNLNIGLIEKEECIKSGLFIQDFIVAKDNVGFKLDDEQTFSIDSLSLISNLILKGKYEEYEEHFNKLKAFVEDKGQYFQKAQSIDDFKKFIEKLKNSNHE